MGAFAILVLRLLPGFEPIMKSPMWTSLAMVTGLALMFVGPLAISFLLPAEALWTDADAQRLGQAGANFHAAIHASEPHGHAHSPGKSAAGSERLSDLAAAQREFDEAQAQLNRSRSRQNWLRYGASILGALVAAVGVAGHFLVGRTG